MKNLEMFLVSAEDAEKLKKLEKWEKCLFFNGGDRQRTNVGKVI